MATASTRLTAASTLGTEVDLVAAWTFRPYAQIEAAVARYFRGDYIKQSLAAVGSKDANYVLHPADVKPLTLAALTPLARQVMPSRLDSGG